MNAQPALAGPLSAPSPDLEHLRLLAIFHYVMAAIGAVFACFPLIHVGFGVVMVVRGIGAESGDASAPPPAIGFLLIAVSALLVVLGWALAICTFLSGRFIAQRRHRVFSIVIAGILCTFMPLGTALGVFTIIVLARDSVHRLYTVNRAAPWGPEPKAAPLG